MTLRLQEILTEARWVRELARQLAAPGLDADDLVQDACLVAMQRPPERHENLRGWLAKVLQNLVRQRQRQDIRRKNREDAAQTDADPGRSAPSTADLVERAATQRAVVDAVLTLDEPYRSTVLLRFFEDLPPREIARQKGIPVGTVHTHLTRGLERLRLRLDKTRGSRQAWMAALLPLIPMPATASAVGALAMKTKFIAATAIAVTAIAVTATTIDWTDAPVAAPETGSNAQVASADVDRPTVPPTTDGAPVREAATPTTPPAEPVANVTPAPPERRATGRTVDPEGNPLPNLDVVLAPRIGGPADDAPRTTSDAAAAFEIPLGGSYGRIVAADAGWTTVMAAAVRNTGVPKLALVVAAPTLALAGHVRGADGAVLAGANVQIAWPEDLRSRLSDNSDAATTEAVFMTTGDDGAFALAAARVRGAMLVTTKDGYVPDRRELPALDSPGLDIVLQKPVARDGAVQGQVVDARNMPVAGATVALGSASIVTDEAGMFVIDDDGESPRLAVAHPGHRRGIAERPEHGWPGFVVLPLGAQPLAIRGRVVDADGRGVADIKVWITDGTLHGGSVSEGIASDCVSVDEIIARFRRGEITNPRQTVSRTPTTMWPFVFTDSNGEFELGGLEDRAYALRAMAMDTLLMVDVQGIPAGSTGNVITMPADAVFATLGGTIVGADGQPVEGATVRLQCDTVSVGRTNMHGGTEQVATTDAEGRFRLTDVPKTRVYLRIDGEPILPREFGRGAAGGLLELSQGDERNVRITVRRRLHVQVTLQDTALATSLAVLDAEDEPLPINVFTGNGRRTTDTLAFEDGRSPVFVVPDTAARLVLLRGEEVVRRETLTLSAGDVNQLTY